MARPEQRFERYGLYWSPLLDPVLIEMHMIKNGGQWKKKDGSLAGKGLFYHYRALQSLLWPEDDHHRWSDLMLQNFLENTITAVLGPKDCVAGNTRIWNPLTGESPTILELFESSTSPIVQTAIGPVKASPPFYKGKDSLFEIVCENGSRFTATRGHLVLSETGFVPCGQLRIGQYLVGFDESHRESIEGFYPLVREPSVQNFGRTTQDSQFCCRHESCSCDEQPQISSASYQCVFPSPDDVQEHILSESSEDDPASRYRHILISQPPFHPSSDRCLVQNRNRTLRTLCECHCVSKTLSPEFYWSRPYSQCRLKGNPCLPYPTPIVGFDHKHSFVGNHTTVQKTKVQTINYIGCGDFFDLTVPIAHHYIANGLIHHNSSKTHTMSKFGLTDYFVFPNDTLIMISSTDLRGLEYRVWGDLKGMFQRAKERYDWLPGFLIDSKHAICTQNVREEEVRDMRKGMVCIPCLSSTGQYVGLGKYVGIKQKRRRLLGDELQFMKASYVESIANLNSGDFKGVFIGNPLGENDPLDKVSEPLNGWPSIGLPEKTTVWTNRFLNGKTVNLVGTDSPNFDFPQDKAPRYSYLINQGSIDRVVAFYKKDSSTYFSQCVGIRRSGVDGHRVITRQICDQFNAFKNAVWEGTNITRIYGLDAAYGNLGGDRCVGGYIEFGRDADGLIILRVNPPVIIPVSVKVQSKPEDQIATFVMNDCISAGIPPENMFFDSTGRGTLGTGFAQIWSAMVNPVEFGGKSTQRPVSDDLLIYDPKLKRKRLKRCDEEYRKFVTELWFSVRRIIESGQMCELPLEVMEEGCMREWKEVEGNKIEIESKKETKLRMGRSPDLFDWLVCCVEGARQRGFVISSQSNEESEYTDHKWKRELEDYQFTLATSGQLNYDA